MNIKRLFLVYVLLAHGLPLDSIIFPICHYRFLITASDHNLDGIGYAYKTSLPTAFLSIRKTTCRSKLASP